MDPQTKLFDEDPFAGIPEVPGLILERGGKPLVTIPMRHTPNEGDILDVEITHAPGETIQLVDTTERLRAAAGLALETLDKLEATGPVINARSVLRHALGLPPRPDDFQQAEQREPVTVVEDGETKQVVPMSLPAGIGVIGAPEVVS